MLREQTRRSREKQGVKTGLHIIDSNPPRFLNDCLAAVLERDDHIVISPWTDGLLDADAGMHLIPEFSRYKALFHPSLMESSEVIELRRLSRQMEKTRGKKRNRLREKAQTIISSRVIAGIAEMGVRINEEGLSEPVVGMVGMTHQEFEQAQAILRNQFPDTGGRQHRNRKREEMLRRLKKVGIALGLATIATITFANMVAPIAHADFNQAHATNPLGNGGTGPFLSPQLAGSTPVPIIRLADGCPVRYYDDMNTVIAYPPNFDFTLDGRKYRVLAAVQMAKDVPQAYYDYKQGDTLCYLQAYDEHGVMTDRILRAHLRGDEVTYIEQVNTLTKNGPNYIWIDGGGINGSDPKLAAVIFTYNPVTKIVDAQIRDGVIEPKVSHPRPLPADVKRITAVTVLPPAPTSTPQKMMVDNKGNPVTPAPVPPTAVPVGTDTTSTTLTSSGVTIFDEQRQIIGLGIGALVATLLGAGYFYLKSSLTKTQGELGRVAIASEETARIANRNTTDLTYQQQRVEEVRTNLGAARQLVEDVIRKQSANDKIIGGNMVAVGEALKSSSHAGTAANSALVQTKVNARMIGKVVERIVNDQRLAEAMDQYVNDGTPLPPEYEHLFD